VISTERLNVRALASGFLAREVTDQAWAGFLKLLEYKAEEAGTQLIKVPPEGTSQDCSICGTKVPKRLSDRIHTCSSCHLVVDRDTNAARNILRLGLSLQASTWLRERALPEKAYSISRTPLHLTLGMVPTTIDTTNRPFHVLKESK
jgi:transposase